MRTLYLPHLERCVIDDIDYEWASRWLWNLCPSKNGKKIYIRRSKKLRGGKWISIWLHKAICYREHGMPPTPSHIVADHKNGNSMDNRRSNLRWATVRENRENYNGVFALQLRLDFKTGTDERIKRIFTPEGNECLCGLPATSPLPPTDLSVGIDNPSTATRHSTIRTSLHSGVPF